MNPARTGFLTDVAPFVGLATLPLVVGFVVGYRSSSYRENVLRGAGRIAAGFVGVTLLVGSYYLLQHVLGGDVHWPDTVTFVAVYGFLLVVVVATYALVVGAVGLALSASVEGGRG